MTNGARTITDPFNNSVNLLEGICNVGPETHADIYDDAAMVIRKPAIMVELKNEERKELYYFRSVGWHKTLLIGVHLENEQWVTFSCEKNPSNDLLSELLRKGRQLV